MVFWQQQQFEVWHDIPCCPRCIRYDKGGSVTLMSHSYDFCMYCERTSDILIVFCVSYLWQKCKSDINFSVKWSFRAFNFTNLSMLILDHSCTTFEQVVHSVSLYMKSLLKKARLQRIVLKFSKMVERDAQYRRISANFLVNLNRKNMYFCTAEELNFYTRKTVKYA